MSKRDVVVLGAARSAIGTFGGSLADIEPAELAGTVMKEAVKRSGVDPKAINYVTVGNTIPTESRFAYVRLRRRRRGRGDEPRRLPFHGDAQWRAHG